MLKILIALSLAYITYVLLSDVLATVFADKLVLNNRLKTIKNYSPYGNVKHQKTKQKKNSKISSPAKLKNDLNSAGVKLRPDEFIKIWIMVSVVPPILIYIINQSFLSSLIVMVIGLIAPKFYLLNKKRKRIELFNRQLGDALLVISNSLKAGFTFEQALKSISKDLADPIGTEFKTIVREMDLGEKLEVSMGNVATRMNSKEMELLNTAVSIQREIGGNLSNIIDNISSTIRERIKLQKKIKTLTAQGEMSGKVIALLPVLVLVSFSVLNPEYMEPMFTTTYGYVLLTISVLLEVIGFVVIKKITNIEM